MTLRRLLLATALAGSFILTTPTAAKADPISAAIVAFVGFTGTAAAVATFVINSALYAAGSWAISKVTAKMSGRKQSVQERQASVLTLSLGEVPREAVIGTALVGGSLIDAFNDGGEHGTDRVTRCIALADHACDALLGYWVDDTYVAFASNGVQAGFEGKLEVYFVNATAAGSTPPATYLGKSSPPWSTTDKLVGITHVWVSYTVDDKVWTQHPVFGWVVQGLRAADPRAFEDLGYEGAEPQDWADRSTHVFSRNPVVLDWAYRRGIYAEGRQGEPEHLLIGRGLSAVEAPPERVLSGANLCDEDMGGDRVRYAVGGVLRANDDFRTVAEMFAAATAGQIVQREGGIEIEPGQAKSAVVTITDGDLILGEAVSRSAFLPDSDGGRINTVVPRYVEPGQRWKDHSGAVRRDLDDIAEDRGPREMTLPLVLVQDAAQAGRCAEIARRLARREKRFTLVLGPQYSDLEEGDWIAWQSDRYFGGDTVVFRIESWTLDERWRMRLALREIDADVFADGDEAEAPDPWTPPDTPGALELEDVAVEPIDQGGTEGTLPAARFSWSTPVDDAIRAIRAEVREVGTTVAAPTRTEAVQSGEMIVSNGIGPDLAMEGRLVPIAAPWRPVTPSAWMPIATGSVGPGDTTPGDVATVNTPTLTPVVQKDGHIRTILGLTWSAATNAAGYHVEIWPTGSPGDSWIVPVDGLSLKNYGVSTGVNYSMRVRGVSSTLTPSANWSSTVTTGSVAGDTTAPGVVTGGSATAAIRAVILAMTNPADADFWRARIYRNTVNNSTGSSLIGYTADGRYEDTTGTPGTTYWYWARTEDHSGNLNATYTALGSAAPRLVTGGTDTDPVDPEISNRPRVDTDNRVPQSDFDFVDGGWAPLFNPTSRVITATKGESNGRRYYRASFSASAGGQDVSIGTAGETFRFRVTPNERLSVQLRLGATGPVATVEPIIRFYSEQDSGVEGTAAIGAVLSGTVSFGTLRQAFVTVPSDAFWAEIETYVETSGSGTVTLSLIEPMVTPASAVQTAHPTYSPGPAAIPARQQYVNNDGRVIDGRGLPVNVSAYVLDPVVQTEAGSPPHTSIALAGGTATLVGASTISLPSGSISGLAAATTYAVFRDLQAGAYVALASGSTGYFTDASRYLFVGVHRTADDSGGTYTPLPPPPPGWSGSGGMFDRHEDLEP